MAHILCVTSGLAGMLHASFEVVSRLEAAGHRVTYLSTAPVREAVEAQGFTYVQLPLFDPEALTRELPPAGSVWRRGLRRVGRWTGRSALLQAGIEALDLDEHVRVLQSLDPDLIVADMEVHESILAAYQLDIPVVLLSAWFSTWQADDLPHIRTDTIPGEGADGQSREMQQAWRRAERKTRRRRLRQRLRGNVERGDVLAYYAKQIGFPRGELQWASFPPPFLYRTLPVLSMTLPALEFPHTPRPGLRYVGPMVYAERTDTRSDTATEERVDEVIRLSRETGKPLVYCTVSSMDPGDTAFLKKLVSVFAERQDWLLVLGLGGNVERSEFEPLPDNVFAFSWIPQLRILAGADVSINHGGIHTINECIHFGVPMLIYSGKRYDQDGCAARVAYHGFGLRGDKDRDGAHDIEQKLEYILTDTGIRDTVHRAREAYLHARKNEPLDGLDAYLAQL